MEYHFYVVERAGAAAHIGGMTTNEPYAIQCAFARALSLHLRDLRQACGLTQEEVAERAGMASNTYQRYERGISKKGRPANPTLASLISIACVFDVDVRELLVVEYDSSVTDVAGAAPSRQPRELPPVRP